MVCFLVVVYLIFYYFYRFSAVLYSAFLWTRLRELAYSTNFLFLEEYIRGTFYFEFG